MRVYVAKDVPHSLKSIGGNDKRALKSACRKSAHSQHMTNGTARPWTSNQPWRWLRVAEFKGASLTSQNMDKETVYHAHFDCFSGAAGDMMLAACLDASGDGESLMKHVQCCIEQGLPDLRDEFSLEMKLVRKGEMGSIASNYVTVNSRYDHAPTPIPSSNHTQHDDRRHDNGRESHNHDHEPDLHSHSHDHMSASHSHDHTHSSSGPRRNLPKIRSMLELSLTEFIPIWVRDKAIETFTELAMAEATTHGASSLDAVHFHEVGAVDSIIDTVGTLLALYCLGVRSVSCSRLPLGEGTVWTDHGLLPVPAPATLRLMVDMPTCPGPPGVTGELVTPTAAALLRVLTRTKNRSNESMGRPPCFTIRKIGIGAGTKDFVKHPNIIRLILGNNVQR